MNRVIITGGNGFIGRHLVNKLLSCKLDSLTVLSNTSNMNHKILSDSQILKDTPLNFYTADIRDRKKISDIFSGEKPDLCIHLAAKTSVADSIKNPEETMEINVKGTLNVLEACYRSKVKNFVFASSAAVYGDIRELPISENSTLKPLSPYGTSKMLAEQHVWNYNRAKKIQNTASLRIFNVYGRGNVSQSDVISKFAARLANGLPPVISGNGNHTRDFISVDDVVEGILLSIRAMENNYYHNLSYPPVFNIGSGIPTSIRVLALRMISISGLKLNPIYEKQNYDRGVILHSYADMTRTKKTFHFVPKKNLDMGLKEILTPPNIVG